MRSSGYCDLDLLRAWLARLLEVEEERKALSSATGALPSPRTANRALSASHVYRGKGVLHTCSGDVLLQIVGQHVSLSLQPKGVCGQLGGCCVRGKKRLEEGESVLVLLGPGLPARDLGDAEAAHHLGALQADFAACFPPWRTHAWNSLVCSTSFLWREAVRFASARAVQLCVHVIWIEMDVRVWWQKERLTG